MSSALENEDLENVALVRMEDVQPSRDRIDRTIEIHIPPATEEDIFEVGQDDILDYNDYIDEDSDSNIGSMVSVHSEELCDEEDEDGCSDTEEVIVPELLDHPRMKDPLRIRTLSKSDQTDSWPTLEILPGGVIKSSIDCEVFPTKTETKPSREGQGEMMYACAKCSQMFKYLFCLVKHVKWHEDQSKVMSTPHLRRINGYKPQEYICLHTGNKKIMLPETNCKGKLPKRLKS
uniref:SFRICE_026139 n=1 Tax=Spodoptera frugiperda TaxID=7108 RepID=A0A2H1WSJ0_SPOFR